MRNESTKNMTYMAMMAALALVATILIRVPVPATQGYIHPGDAVVMISVMMLGAKRGAASGALGEAMADLLGGYAIFSPITFAAKLLMGVLVALAIKKYCNKKKTGKTVAVAEGLIFLLLACFSMVAVYYFAEAAIYGNLIIPLAEIPANIIQFSVSAVLAGIMGGLIRKSPVKTMLNKNY